MCTSTCVCVEASCVARVLLPCTLRTARATWPRSMQLPSDQATRTPRALLLALHSYRQTTPIVRLQVERFLGAPPHKHDIQTVTSVFNSRECYVSNLFVTCSGLST